MPAVSDAWKRLELVSDLLSLVAKVLEVFFLIRSILKNILLLDYGCPL